jgi:hypothetical protein
MGAMATWGKNDNIEQNLLHWVQRTADLQKAELKNQLYVKARDDPRQIYKQTLFFEK